MNFNPKCINALVVQPRSGKTSLVDRFINPTKDEKAGRIENITELLVPKKTSPQKQLQIESCRTNQNQQLRWRMPWLNSL